MKQYADDEGLLADCDDALSTLMNNNGTLTELTMSARQ